MGIIIGYLKIGIIVITLWDAFIIAEIKDIKLIHVIMLMGNKKFMIRTIILALAWPLTIFVASEDIYEQIIEYRRTS